MMYYQKVNVNLRAAIKVGEKGPFKPLVLGRTYCSLTHTSWCHHQQQFEMWINAISHESTELSPNAIQIPSYQERSFMGKQFPGEPLVSLPNLLKELEAKRTEVLNKRKIRCKNLSLNENIIIETLEAVFSDVNSIC